MRRLVPLLLAAAALAAPVAADARTIRPLPDTWHKGANVAAFRWDGFSGDRFYYWMRQLRHRANADRALFTMRWIQYWRDDLRGDDVNATEISPAYGNPSSCGRGNRQDYTRCQTPTLAATRKAMEYAKSLGMEVGLKPLVDVGRKPQSQTGRDQVSFGDATARAAWFDSYRYMLGEYARLARDMDADLLVIGTGLTKMADDADEQAEWRRIIRDVRSGELMGDGRGGFAGTLTYAASREAIFEDAYDPGAHQFFWDDLDVIGVEGFWPLVDHTSGGHDDPPVARLREGWTYNYLEGGMPPGAALRALHDEYAKPVLLTGLGYLSRGGTSANPAKGDYEQAAAGGKVNTRAQQRPYRAAFDFWSGVARQGWFRGIYWWNWLPKIGNARNGDYTAQGKPAETELCLRHLGRFTRKCRPSGMPR